MSTSLEDLTPDTKRVVDRLIELGRVRNIEVRISSTFRTCEEQAAVYAQGRTTPGVISSGASGCRSWHTWGRAVDLFIVHDGKTVDSSDHRYDELGDIAKSLGMLWGGDFSRVEKWHFEYHPGMVIDDVCPDSAQEACSEQIQRHNAKYAPPVDPSVQPVVGYDGSSAPGFSLTYIVASAAIGAMVFHMVNDVFDLVNGKKKS